MKKKVLFTASIAKHLLRFHLPYLEWFKGQDYEVHIACNGGEEVPFTDKKWTVPFVRSPFSNGHFKAFKSLKAIIDQEQYTLIHCHTPMASIVTRLAAKDARLRGTKVLYTAHGFHFFKGSPIINWLTYYPVEILTSGYADAIITINTEDFELIKAKGNSNTKYFLIPGIGVDNEKFFPVSADVKNQLRAALGFEIDDFLAVYAAEFIDRKNHRFLIEAIAVAKNKFPKLKVLFCGRGELKKAMEALVKKYDLEATIIFMGFRNDVDQLYKIADIGISSSKQEGLGLNLVEEMMCGLPILATVDRGHKEIVFPGENGFLFEQENKQEFIKYLNLVYSDRDTRNTMRQKSIKLADKFEISNSLAEMSSIYKKFI